MKILFVTDDFSGASLCRRLKLEGNEIKASVGNPVYRRVLDGIVEKTEGLDSGLNWVKKDGLVVFDDIGFGKLQDTLRKEGFSVVGGSEAGDKLEADRPFAQQTLSDHGIDTVPMSLFDNISEAIRFVEKNRGMWVIKRNGNPAKSFCYVGQMPDGADVIDQLKHYGRMRNSENTHVVLQRRIFGVEIGVSRFFNGTDWTGPVEMAVEHKKFFHGDLGPKTSEMGTLIWYDGDENNRLFKETLLLLKPYLQQGNFRGNVNINCIVNEEGAFPLEVTSRFGYPAIQLEMGIHVSPWGEFLKAIADGENYPLEWRTGYGIVVLIATPQFPYCNAECMEHLSPKGLKIHFINEPNEEDLQNFHFEGIEMRRNEHGKEEYYICDDTGYIMHVCGIGKTIEEARELTYQRIRNIVIPKMFYRTDIGMKFIEQDRNLLEEWGYIKSPCFF